MDLQSWREDQNPKAYTGIRVSNERSGEDICPQEISNAICYVLREKGALDKATLLKETCRLFGFRTMLPTMQSDIMLSKGSRVLIIDAKYYSHTTQKQYDTNKLHSHNLYQIFTYVKNKEAELKDHDHQFHIRGTAGVYFVVVCMA